MKLNRKEKPNNIGECLYHVKYKKCDDGLLYNFTGICENFSTGLSAFWSEEKECMLLVDYKNILGLYPINQ